MRELRKSEKKRIIEQGKMAQIGVEEIKRRLIDKNRPQKEEREQTRKMAEECVKRSLTNARYIQILIEALEKD
jgi:hypothetical protein